MIRRGWIGLFQSSERGGTSEMPGPKGEQCSSCYYWVAFGSGTEEDGEPYEVGMCRRYPPSIPYEENWDRRQPINQDPSIAAWAGSNSKSSYWCGEFKLKPRAASDEGQ